MSGYDNNLLARVARDAAEHLVIGERRRQVEAEGYDPEHDDEHTAGELADAAACYIQDPGEGECHCEDPPPYWPWEEEHWKPSPEESGITGRVRELVKGTALALAEIERLIRADMRDQALVPDIADLVDRIRRGPGAPKGPQPCTQCHGDPMRRATCWHCDNTGVEP